MTHATTFDLVEMKKRAEAASPGPWKAVRSIPAEGADVWWLVGNRESNNAEVDLGSIQGGLGNGEANAAHIAASSPSAVLALLAAYDEQVERVKELERDVRITAQVAIDQVPKPLDASREAILAAVEEWVNRSSGEATVDEIASAVLAAAVNAGWLMAPAALLVTPTHNAGQEGGENGPAGHVAIYVEPVENKRTRCRCGCGKAATHRVMGNDACLSQWGCEASVNKLAQEIQRMRALPDRCAP